MRDGKNGIGMNRNMEIKYTAPHITPRPSGLLIMCACVRVLRLVHNTMLNNTLHCVAFTSTFVEMQYDTRIDSDPIIAFPCAVFLRLVIKKSPIINLCVSRINTMQGLASVCELDF